MPDWLFQCLRAFINDPPDSSFQEGYLECALWVAHQYYTVRDLELVGNPLAMDTFDEARKLYLSQSSTGLMGRPIIPEIKR